MNESRGARILIVDDDRHFAAMLAELLETEGHTCETAHNGSRGLRLALDSRPDLVVLDVMMPGDDGVTTLRRLRERSSVPVIMLTAMGEDEHRVLGLEAGADDYLAKPFVPRELVLRIGAILRRGVVPADRPESTALEAGPLHLDAARQRASVDGVELGLTTAETRILEALMMRPGSVVARDHLTRFALGREPLPHDRALDTHVSHLRRKIDAASPDRCRIRSVRGAGYRLIVD